MKSIKKLLKEKELVIGPMVMHTASPWVVKIYADAGADFVYIENEHTFFNEAELANLILGCRLCGLPAVAKSTYLDRGNIAKLLEAGVNGVQLPMTESAEQMTQFVKYIKFPPEGVRAAAPGMGNTDYKTVDCRKWLQQANKETTVIAHIETAEGVEHIDEILKVPGVDIMFVGIVDLSISLGCPVCFDHPEVVKAMEKLLGSAKEHDKVAGMYARDYYMAKLWIEKGVRFFETMGDVGLLANGVSGLVRKFPGHSVKTISGTGHI